LLAEIWFEAPNNSLLKDLSATLVWQKDTGRLCQENHKP